MNRTLTAAVALGLASAFVLASPKVEAAAPTADKPWSGYGLPKTSNASSSWIGGRSTGGQIVYRIDPSRPKARTQGFRPAQWQQKTLGTGPRAASATDTARAAWIVGKYGRFRYGVQNAAVEVALDHLLHGGGWALSGSTTRKRLARTGNAAAIKRFASTMLNDSATFAGPYAIDLSSTQVRAGQSATVTVTVTSARTGAGIAKLPVATTYSGQSARSLRTDSQGVASFTVPAGSAGPHKVTAVISRLPEDRLLVRSPTTRGASRVVVAGRKTTRTKSATVAVRASPAVTSVSTSSSITTAQQPTGQFTIQRSYPSPRGATANLYGPFSSAAATDCDPARLARSSTKGVTGDGTYSIQVPAVQRGGYYIWGTSVGSDAYNLSASTCSGVVLARAKPTISAHPTGSSYRAGAYIQGLVTVTGLPAADSSTASLRLYGPFSSAPAVSCDSNKLLASQQVAIAQNGTVNGPTLTVTRLGYYLWAADLPAGPFSLAASSSCSASASTFQVIR